MERAKPDVTVTRAAQMDRSAYHVDNVHCLLHKSGNSRTSHLANLKEITTEKAKGENYRFFSPWPPLNQVIFYPRLRHPSLEPSPDQFIYHFAVGPAGHFRHENFHHSSHVFL